MSATSALHRVNDLSRLVMVRPGGWVETDLDMHRGHVIITHDPIDDATADALDAALAGNDDGRPRPLFLEEFLPAAAAAGVGGLILDCKRENVELAARPLLARGWTGDFFWLNEMEVQADIFSESDPGHRGCMRVWKRRGADEVISTAEDAVRDGRISPTWVWVDCWDRELRNDIERAVVPLSGREAGRLRELGVRLCICSPELYAFRPEFAKNETAMATMRRGVRNHQTKLKAAGITADMVCTKFPEWWDLEQSRRPSTKDGRDA